MAEIISRRKKVHVESYAHSFSWRNDPGAGFSFDCDALGNILDSVSTEARSNLHKCKYGKYDVIYNGIKDYSYNYWQAMVIKCHCGREVQLCDAMTNDCECGQIYNGSGQELAPMSQWEENMEEDY